MQPGVRTGADRLDKRPFVGLEHLGDVTDIQFGELRLPGKTELGVAGYHGAGFFDQSGKPDGSVNFADGPHDVAVSADIVRQSRSHGLLFLRRGDVGQAILADAGGREIWRTPYVPIASTFADLREEGMPQFLFVGQDAALEARDISGAVIWRKEDFGWTYDIWPVGPEKSPPAELLADVTGTLIGVGTDGQILFRRKPASIPFFSDFVPIRWPSVCDGQCLLVSGDNKISLLTLDGEQMVAELGPATYAMKARAVSVRLNENEPPFLAVGGLLAYKGGQWFGFKLLYGSLYVFDARRNLLYHEVLPEPIGALGTLPAADGKTERLLVGGVDKVWQYSAPHMKIPEPQPSH